ncbi:MAG: NAD(P)-dependent oxidoreductase [Comamonadaceae bacterium]|nr:MAG: NAD(P)-dependent oxidoreductase [Comamonadaceae bacterium]
MSTSVHPDLRPHRLGADEYALRFADASPRLSKTQALLEAERCLYCFDAPCAAACPTHIDVPSFIRRIAEDNLRGAATSILDANPLGGMCARVCPTENLCEQVCVRTTQSAQPVAIGRLQRYATDALMESAQPQIFTRAASTGRKVAVLGAGPAGLACAHTLARLGHQVLLLDAHEKAGGLNEYGLASYKTTDNFAQTELQWLLGIGGIELRTGWKLETAAQLDALRADFDALFLGIGLAATHQLGMPGEDLAGVQDAVDFIAALRQSADLSALPIGRRVVVIGGGMTAVDAAVQAKLLGAEDVHMVYRRGPEQMSASKAEQDWAQTHGVTIHHWLAPLEVTGSNGHASAVQFGRQALVDGKLCATGEVQTLAADMVLKAIGQRLGNPVLAQSGLQMRGDRIATDDVGKTSLQGVWAGGDCRAGGLELTVEAVAHGKQSALAIHEHLMNPTVSSRTPQMSSRTPDRARGKL